MDVILNELSICGQYEDIQAFEDMVAEELHKILGVKGICIHKKSDTFTRMITPSVSMYEALRRANQTAATLLKQAMVGPYWDEDTEYEEGAAYQYPGKCQEPNGVTEAMDRQWPLLSLKDGGFEEEEIATKRDGQEIAVDNIRSLEKVLELLLLNDAENIKYILEKYPYAKPVVLKQVGNRCYAKEALLENELTIEDQLKFVRHLTDVIRDKSTGTVSHWYKPIEDNINEYRLSISAGRELRVFFVWDSALTLLNGFIKKSQETPLPEKKKAREIAKS